MATTSDRYVPHVVVKARIDHNLKPTAPVRLAMIKKGAISVHDLTRRMLDRHDSTDDAHNRVLNVWTDDDAMMTVPTAYWVHHLSHGQDNTRPGACSDRLLAAGVCDSFRYLVMNCTKEEAWRRIKLLREAIENEPTDD